ncbi:16S rRNA (adenine(1518)-N(6)/adenine(1519)-N(6))-dimethyltransferase RsmA [Methylococcus sp. EFPC2]|uniref:16S rRNA (adenine(1518)-N(6)/adenine(1519)-N(6))- dimethyltransferase RsmA n=1 Tax=Methylococcus sp. EFPC2 TaxID=2812648 RepID=UPI001967914B|nr:16S rRNA (adenine(1518)-N(6)/adenine(1519)-N(6))-dimethyltransferase RsmA [Methylococcus sp. EFPC2]QSA98670.1 16S rRNA (adenine(1518)-N(6)/adenine(1519)-N(6))-dimethyltransferase RsmA [Methylococcus sp. EFPC2]
MSHQPRKRFGQNFLRDQHVIYAIVAAIGPREDEHLVEIGPGQGALTSALLAECGRLDVVELDRDLVVRLKERYAGSDKLRIHSGDALKFDFAALSKGEKLRVVGNLPYNISTPLLFHLFGQAQSISDMHFMLQKEVVDRLCASPGDSDYGRLSIMAQYHCAMECLMDVPPDSFYPPPKVMSAVVRLIPHARPPVEADPVALGRVVTAAFAQRRKTLRNALSALFSADELRDLGVDPTARAETLALEDYARLAGRYGSRE